jgi:hypothetical protein
MAERSRSCVGLIGLAGAIVVPKPISGASHLRLAEPSVSHPSTGSESANPEPIDSAPFSCGNPECGLVLSFDQLALGPRASWAALDGVKHQIVGGAIEHFRILRPRGPLRVSLASAGPRSDQLVGH